MEFFAVEGLSQKSIAGIFVLKIIFGLMLWMLYTHYYTNRAESDIFKFHDDAAYMYEALPNHPLHYLQMVTGINGEADYLNPYYERMTHWVKPWEGARFHDNKLIIQVNAQFYLFSFGYYNVHTVFMCFLSLIGLVAIYKTFAPLLKDKLMELTFAVFFIPSVLFWGSGVLKEGLIILGLGLTLYSANALLFYKRSVTFFVLFVLSAFILLNAKMYVFAALLPALISLIVVRFTGEKNILAKFLIVHLVLFVAAMNVYRLHIGVNTMFFLHQKQMGFIHTAIAGKAGSYFTINYLDENVWSLIKNSPSALFNALFRPHLFESKSVLIFISAVENAGFMILTVMLFFFYKKPSKESLPMLYTLISFVFILALLIGLVTPVLGSIVRYKLPLLPLYVIILLLLFDKQKATKRLSGTLYPQ
jgi:hypothetical protein